LKREDAKTLRANAKRQKVFVAVGAAVVGSLSLEVERTGGKYSGFSPLRRGGRGESERAGDDFCRFAVMAAKSAKDSKW
jgi:hypothetical protein